DKPECFLRIFARQASVDDHEHQEEVPILNRPQQIRKSAFVISACRSKLLPEGKIDIMELDHIEQVFVSYEFRRELPRQGGMTIGIADRRIGNGVRLKRVMHMDQKL